MSVWITLPVTYFCPGPDFSPGIETTAGLGSDRLPVVLGRNDDIIEIKPGVPFECESEEVAKYLVLRHGGKYVDGPKSKSEL